MAKTPVLIDMNLTEDFAAGFLTALAQNGKGLDILGISLSYGQTDIETALNNTRQLLGLAGQTMEIALGATMPLMANYAIQPAPMPLCQAFNGLMLDTPKGMPTVKEAAPDFLYNKLKAAAKTAKATILCAGPMTNIAHLLQSYPDAPQYIEKIIWRGGSFRHGSIDIVKEPQTYMDPDAAGLALSYGLPFVVCPLDIQQTMYATLAEIDAQMLATDEMTHQKNRLLKKRWCDHNAHAPLFKRSSGVLPLWDVAAVAYLLEPQLFKATDYYAEVDRKGRLTYGMFTVHSWLDEPRHGDATNITLLRDVNREKAIAYLYN